MRLAAAALTALTMLGVGLAVSPSTSPAGAVDGSPAVSLFSGESASPVVIGARRGVQGSHRLVTLSSSAFSALAPGLRLRLPVGGGDARVQIADVAHQTGFTAWTGRIEGQDLSSFNLVRAAGVYRGAMVSPEGVYSLVRADGDNYWWTEVEPQRGESGADGVRPPVSATTAPLAMAPLDKATLKRAQRGKAKVSVMFAYTEAVKAEAGGLAELKAAAALVISQTNETFRNSGLKVNVRYKGIAKAKGKESGDALKDVFRLYRTRDGHFDNLTKARRKHHADLVHMFTTGSQYDVCGAGMLPATPRLANRSLGWSMSFLSCMPYLVATHELGHNLGADHIEYPGVDRFSRLSYSYAFYNVPGNYFSVMGYYDPCQDVEIYTCVRLPWFSSPTNTYNGQPLGTGRATNNTLVVKRIAPRVARYYR